MTKWPLNSWRRMGLSVERLAAPQTGDEHGWYLQPAAEGEVLS